MSKCIAALYHFAQLDNYTSLKQPILEKCLSKNIKGTLLLASEGINGTISGNKSDIEEIISYLRQDPRLKNLTWKESTYTKTPFPRMKVKLKKEIVTIGNDKANPACIVGTYVKPSEWNALLEDPDVLVLDTRNDYEIAIGTFKNAISPNTTNFREFPDYVASHLNPKKHKKVAMFCTGGIRCEKASSLMLNEGFEEVYHLEGGILKYLEEVPESQSLWHGECFVFDQRVSVNHQLEKGRYSQCYGCRRPITEEDMQSSYYEKGVSCHHCYHETSAEQKSSFAMRQKQIDQQNA